MTTDDWMSITEAASALGVHPTRVRALIAEERLPAKKFARDWLIHRSDLDRVAVRMPGRGMGAHATRLFGRLSDEKAKRDYWKVQIVIDRTTDPKVLEELLADHKARVQYDLQRRQLHVEIEVTGASEREAGVNAVQIIRRVYKPVRWHDVLSVTPKRRLLQDVVAEMDLGADEDYDG